MKKVILAFSFLALANTLTAQIEEENVKKVLMAYKSALEKLNVTGTETLFTANSQIIESGKVEGTYQDYIAHHIGPELADFSSFKFENYKVEVSIVGDYAFALETYNYILVLKKDNSEVKRKGVATSVLKKENGAWRIHQAHNSSRKY